MSLPATHLFYIQKQFENKNLHPDFLLGNIFPDVRYELDIPREVTHSDITTPKALVAHIEKKIPLDLDSPQKRIIAGMFCHSFHDVWWRSNVYIETSNPYIKPALFLAEEWVCLSLLDKAQMKNKLLLVREHTISGINSNRAVSFVDNVIEHLNSLDMESSPLLEYWKLQKKWNKNDLDHIKEYAQLLLENKEYVRQTGSLRNAYWGKEVIESLREYAIQENESEKTK